ncbi:MAG: DUF881 domain-containing protein [Actinomycetota bacterium]
MQPASRGLTSVIPAILLLIGFLVTSAVVEERRREEQLPTRAAELLDLIRTQENGIEELSAEARSLSAGLRELQRSGAVESERLREALTGLDRLALPSSVAPAHGPGVVVELADSEASPRTRGELTDLRIQDVDLRLVVNALWQAGAEAVAINGHRVGGITAIRAAGDRILVNFAPIASPYRVSAIGSPEGLESGLRDSEISQQFGVWTQIYGLGFGVRTEQALSVPGLETAERLEWARPVGRADA